MSLRVLQRLSPEGTRQVICLSEDETPQAYLVPGVATVRDLALKAISEGTTLAEALSTQGEGPEVDVALELAEGRILAPIDHPDPAHLHLTGTGLTHLGSAEGRDKMHRAAAEGEAQLTDSMRMFLMGIKGGKPAKGEMGAQPEWFYKGNGYNLIGPGGALRSPAFAGDGGEEPEIAGIYLIGPEGQPFRLGFALINEFSDHVTEKQNYLWLAHSKLRPAAIGAELRTGPLPAHIAGMSRIRRGNQIIWEKPFMSGEDNMSHSLDNLERHHFKYPIFCQPGDVHVHCFGTATASFADGIETRDGDVFEIEADAFHYGLSNRLETLAPAEVKIRAL